MSSTTAIRRYALAFVAAATVACVLVFLGTAASGTGAFDGALPSFNLAESPAQPKAGNGSLSWLPADSGISCGGWPTDSFEEKLRGMDVDTSGLGWQCADGTTEDKLNKRTVSGEITKEVCKTWCDSQHNASQAVQGKWCCQWTPSSRSGGECTWSNGMRVYTQAKCVMQGGVCVKPLAYEACSFAGEFEPKQGKCKRGSRAGLLGAYKAPTLNACSQLCLSTITASACDTFAFSMREQACGRSSCELYSGCRNENRPSETDATFDWYAKKPTPSRASMLGSSSGDMSADADGSTDRWPEQLGEPLGLRVDPNHAPPSPALLAVMGAMGARVGAPAFSPTEEYQCDTESGRKADNAANFGGDWPNSCSQICLPTAFWGPAAKRGVQRAKCKENGCNVFVAARKYAGVPYNIYNCTCPTTNASALYDCPADKPDEGGGGDTLVC
ncbi:hypothetical protein KFE25_005299 [Diacronema lutheri]|uniref:Apple domain-containing protein n=1 Tax=Diacronema lutheri TaxID=2081491 RepID=A0A8J6CAP3_DIALT|nr:hypothetical protein KFE25_005299 [Diacronema lutheri]